MAFATSRKGVKSDINVTPLVDVVLVLLIIFMVITPMLQRGKDVNLPKAATSDEEEKSSDPLVLSVTKDGKTFIESTSAEGDALEQKVSEALQKEPGKKVMLKGDENLTVGDMRKVMLHARTAGAKRVALAVQEKK